MAKRGFMDGYKTYDTSDGFGNRQKWRESFKERMSGEEAQVILDKQDDSPWGILGVKKGDSAEVITAAFRKLMKEWHPDKNPHRIKEATEMTQKIIAAYTILK